MITEYRTDVGVNRPFVAVLADDAGIVFHFAIVAVISLTYGAAPVNRPKFSILVFEPVGDENVGRIELGCVCSLPFQCLSGTREAA